LNKLKINFIGTGIEIKRILVPNEVIENWKQIIGIKRTITDALLDPFFYYKLKDKQYNSLEDLPSEIGSGILNHPKSQIEFWFNRKKVYKLNTPELFNQNTLFPLFNIEKMRQPFMDTEGIYILQNEIGNIGTYELMVHSDSLNIDDFTFEFASFLAAPFVKNIKYQNQNLQFIKKDTVITYQSCFERF